MLKAVRRYALLLVVLMLASTGCLRSASGELDVPEALGVSTPTPTITPQPTWTPQEAEVFIVTATPDPNVTEVADTGAQAAPDIVGDGQDQGVIEPQSEAADPFAQQQDFPTPSDPLLQEATRIIAAATQQALDLTATAEAPAIPLPTFTPTLDPFSFTATPTQGAIGGPVQGADCVHEVVRGDTLYSLSRRYGVPVDNIARASGVTNVNLISVGQRLTIPGCGTTGTVPPATSTPTFSAVDGAASTPFGTGGAVQPTSAPSAGGITHTVQQYETLYEISLRYNVPVNSIAAANDIQNINLIYMGQELVIP